MEKITKIGVSGINLIKKSEGCRLKSYPDPATNSDPWTIGYGNTLYENSQKVKSGDVITQERADELFLLILKKFVDNVLKSVTSSINQNQFDALVSFCYNVGYGNLKSSTLLKKVNINPNDESIKLEFAKWNKGSGKVLKGLTTRRAAESELYFKSI